MKIRTPKINDLDQLSKLFDDYRVFYRKDSDLNSAKKFLADRIKEGDSKIYICENNKNELVGFIQLYPLFSSTRIKKLWLLNDLFVKTEYRGRGISMKLIGRAKQLIKDSSACAMFLETEKSNFIANNLYVKAGFELNELSNFYEWNHN